MFHLPGSIAELQWTLWLRPAPTAGLSRRLPEVHHVDFTRNLQGRQTFQFAG